MAQAGPEQGTSFRFGPFRLDRARRVLWKGDTLVPVGGRAIDLLITLADRPGEVVTKDELLSRVWPDTFVEEANLSVHVSALRKALDDGAGGRRYIQTVSRRGYRFVPATPEPDTRPTLAVLPFREIPAGADDDLGIGTSVALIGRLSRLSGIVVRSMSATLRYVGRDVDAREAGRELQVGAVVEGTIQRSGPRVRITVQLVRVEGGIAWTDTFEEDFTNLFLVQDSVADQVARALEVELRGGERATLARRPTGDVEAYQAYLRGRFFWSRFTAAWMERAFSCFQEAVERDPSYPLPHAGLADAYLILGFSGLLPPRDAWDLAAGSAETALRLDDRLAEAHVSLAYVRLFRDWDWAAAEDGLLRALAMTPTAATLQWTAVFLNMQGRFAEARRHIEEAARLEPLSLVTSTLRGFQLYLEGDRDAELAQYRATVELDPNHFLGYWGLGLALLAHGRAEEARTAHERAVALGEGQPLLNLVLARTLALSGRAAAARDLLDAAEDLPASDYQRATVHLALEDREAALARLERAATAREPWLVWLEVDPMFAPLRGHPRFQGIVSQVMGAAAAIAAHDD